MSAAIKARMRLKEVREAEGTSHFEQSLQELRTAKKGLAGRSANLQEPLYDEHDDSDVFKSVQILRKASITQEQWDKYLSLGEKPKHPEDVETTALLYQKSSLSQVSGSSAENNGPVLSKKSTNFDIETGKRVQRTSPRLSVSVFFLPLLSPWSPFVQLWTHLILLLDLTYTAFLVPILVGFEVSDVDWSWGALYTIEWFLNFHIGFVGKNKTRRKLVMDGGAIARYYVTKGHFIIDTCTVVVWIAQIVFIILYHANVLENGNVATDVYQAIRILRLVRFTSLLRRLYATAAAAQSSLFPGFHVDSNVASFFNLLFGGAVLTNFLACLCKQNINLPNTDKVVLHLFYYKNFTAIAEGLESTWVNNYSVFVRVYAQDSSADSLTKDEAKSIPGPHRWLVGFYYILVTIGTVGYGDIYPQSVVESIISIFIICIGLVFFGIILGSIAETLQRLSQDAKQAVLFRGRMESVDKWMSQRRLPQRLKNRISNFYAEDWLYGADAGEEVQVMTELPQGLRKEIALSVNLPLFKRLNFLHNLGDDKFVATIASHMAPLQLPAGFELCEEGDVADSVWVLHDGEIAAISWSETRPNITLRAPALIGEIALLQEQNSDHLLRQYSYRTHTSCLLWEVPLREILALLRQRPDLYAKACQQILPEFPFDFFAVDPSSGFSTEDGREAADAVRNATSYKELDENTMANQSMLAQKSALGSRSSQTVTRAELKRSELLRAKSGIGR